MEEEGGEATAFKEGCCRLRRAAEGPLPVQLFVLRRGPRLAQLHAANRGSLPPWPVLLSSPASGQPFAEVNPGQLLLQGGIPSGRARLTEHLSALPRAA